MYSDEISHAVWLAVSKLVCVLERMLVLTELSMILCLVFTIKVITGTQSTFS